MTVQVYSQPMTDQIKWYIDMFYINNSISCLTLGTHDQTCYGTLCVCLLIIEGVWKSADPKGWVKINKFVVTKIFGGHDKKVGWSQTFSEVNNFLRQTLSGVNIFLRQLFLCFSGWMGTVLVNKDYWPKLFLSITLHLDLQKWQKVF